MHHTKLSIYHALGVALINGDDGCKCVEVVIAPFATALTLRSWNRSLVMPGRSTLMQSSCCPHAPWCLAALEQADGLLLRLPCRLRSGAAGLSGGHWRTAKGSMLCINMDSVPLAAANTLTG